LDWSVRRTPIESHGFSPGEKRTKNQRRPRSKVLRRKGVITVSYCN
jgi:hypothetical protein